MNLCFFSRNKSSAFCQPCLDQYWSLESERSECNVQKRKLFEENMQIKRERDELMREVMALKDGKNDIFMINELERCKLKRKRVENLYEKCKDDNVNYQNKIKELRLQQNDGSNECGEYKAKIERMEHELGECNVEWGACEQLGRQKDKLKLSGICV